MGTSGVIGLDKLEDIANLNGVSIAELKAAIPADLTDKIVRFHPQFIEKSGNLL